MNQFWNKEVNAEARRRLNGGAAAPPGGLTGPIQRFAPPVGLSILGGGTSAMILISHNLGGSVSRTFTSPLPTV